jgi:hypothetical protein
MPSQRAEKRFLNRLPTNILLHLFMLSTCAFLSGCNSKTAPSSNSGSSELPNAVANNSGKASSSLVPSAQPPTPTEAEKGETLLEADSNQDAADFDGKLPQEVALFDGTSLEGWEISPFGGQGEVLVQDGALVLEPGFPLTGVTSTRKDLPLHNYEILVEARKTEGIDFFCGLTFPVNETHCSLIVGGWAGAVVGLSQIDHQDAAHNETRRLKKFERGRWYSIRLRVEPKRIRAWIDDEAIVDQDTTDRQLSVRNETLPSRPLGICSFETRAEIRKIALRHW